MTGFSPNNPGAKRPVVFFDAVHTLFDLSPSFSGAFAEVCRDYGRPIEIEEVDKIMGPMLIEVERLARASESHPCSHESLVRRWLDFNREVFEALGGFDGKIHEMSHEVERRFDSGLHAKVYPGAFEAIEQTRALGVFTGILSNGTLGMENCLRVLGLSERVEVVLVSAAAGYEKPDREIFKRAEALAGAAPEQCLMIGDSYGADIAGARRAGWSAIWYNPHNKPAPAPCEQVRAHSEIPGRVRKWLESRGF